jgi:hypothetical protein
LRQRRLRCTDQQRNQQVLHSWQARKIGCQGKLTVMRHTIASPGDDLDDDDADIIDRSLIV